MSRSEELTAALGVALEPSLLERALTHRSYAYEHGGLPTNERLEFLGDAVLGLVVTASLYYAHPDLPEGKLARMRANVVNSSALAEVARVLGHGGVGPHLLLGKGEEGTGGRNKESILADTLEALLGAIFVEHGIETATVVIKRLFTPLINAAANGPGSDWKTALQELTAAQGWGVPEYHIEEAGPDHAKEFTAWAVVADERFGGMTGRTKKVAEQGAAKGAWYELSTRVMDAEHPEATEF